MATLKSAAETALELGREVKESVVEMGRSAGQKIGDARDQASGALHEAAHSVRHSSAKIENLAKGTARRLDATASFVEDFNTKNASVALRRFAKNHSTAVLLTAAAIGFMSGFALGRGRSTS